MKRSAAEIVREYGPFPGADRVNGVTYDGRQVWFAAGDTLNAFDPASGKAQRSIGVAAHAGTAFDGRHLFQIAEDRTNAGFEHAAAPDGDLAGAAEIINLDGGSKAAEAAEFNIDDAAGAEVDGGAGVFEGVDAFVKADGCFEFALEFGVAVEVVPSEGLLDHH